MSAEGVHFSHQHVGRLRSYGNVLIALMLRDVRTRMFGTAWGFLLVIAWPMTHIVAVLLIYAYRSGTTVPPYGESIAVWAATGVVPFMCFSYIARFTTLGVLMNKPLLYFPHIQVSHLLFSRAIIEVLNSSVVILCLLLIFYALGIDVAPRDPADAAAAVLVAFTLGLGFGILNGVIAGIYPAWATFFNIMIVVLWLSSGIFFVPSSLPELARNILAYHPIVNVTEWMREAFYDSYSSVILSRSYVIGWSVALLCVSLLAERLLRGNILKR